MSPSGIRAGRLISVVLSLTLHAAALGAVLHWLDTDSPRGCSGNSPVFTLHIGLPTTAPPEESSSGQDSLADLPAPPSSPLPSTAEFAHLATAREGPAPAPSRKAAGPSRKQGGSGGTGQLIPPRYAFAPAPLYPEELRRARARGFVLLEVLVTPRGDPEEIRVKRSSGYPAMDQSALQSVRGWKFHPALSGKEPVSCRVEVPVRFQLRKT